MKIKHILCIVLVLFFAFSFGGCGNETVNEQTVTVLLRLTKPLGAIFIG